MKIQLSTPLPPPKGKKKKSFLSVEGLQATCKYSALIQTVKIIDPWNCLDGKGL